jgi:hypothetical protein
MSQTQGMPATLKRIRPHQQIEVNGSKHQPWKYSKALMVLSTQRRVRYSGRANEIWYKLGLGGSLSPRLRLAPLAVLSPGQRLAGSPLMGKK